MKFTFVKKQPEAKNITTFWFKPEKELSQIAGQYTELIIPHDNPDERKNRRWFTLSSSPTERLASITTKLDPVRKSSFKTALSGLKSGDIISGHMPMGDFVLPKDETLPLVFVAGGIGITPYRSILKYLLDTGQRRNITLIYSISAPDELAFADLIEKSGVEFIRHIGRLKAKDILAYIPVDNRQVVYISGPENMVETLQNDLIGLGVDKFQIRSDFFHNYD
ncbi:MAG TPA: FAD-dependent oxidoreductase [Candidatus Saccharimonadales bacterium]|nr:FAD-dependent oxidoreductase [Candidatus Saccharimonadales bacterium]